MDPTVRQPLAAIDCQTCHMPLAEDPGSLVHIEHRVVREAEESCGDEVAHWQAHCRPCNPHRRQGVCAGCYAFDPQSNPWLDWNEHMLEKGWMSSTNWREFYSRAVTHSRAVS